MQLVDLHKLETTSLKRYRRAFQLVEVDAAAPKADLVTAVQRHFTTQVQPAQQQQHHLKKEKNRTPTVSPTAGQPGCRGRHHAKQQTHLGLWPL